MSSFVGRDEELEKLQSRFERARNGDGNALFVTGGAGTGKTSLLEQFLLDVSVSEPETQIAVGNASEQYGSGEPYQPFVEAFEELIGSGADPEEGASRKEQLKRLAGKVAPYWLSAVPVAGSIVAAVWETAREVKEEVEEASTGTKRPPNEETLFYQYTELLFAAAEQSPVVLFLDDLHWADEATCSLLGHLSRRVDEKRVLILGTYRPAEVQMEGHPVKKTRQELERYGVADRLELDPLETPALADVVEEELGAPPSPELLHFLEKRAGTTPLFFVEFLRWLADQNFCRRIGGEWDLVGRPDEIEVPRSAKSAIEKRLDRLDEDVERILEYASVQGDEFDSTVLSRLLDVDELELEERLQSLVRRHRLIRPVGERDFPSGDFATVYRFRHSLFQDVLHSNLFGKRRVLLHRKTAEILEDLYGDQTEQVDFELSVHFDQGRQPEKAFEAALRAADKAASLYAHTDAIELLERARKNVPGTDEEIDVLERLARQHRILGRYGHALQELEQAIQAAREIDAPSRLLALRIQLVRVALDYGDRLASNIHDELIDLADRAREMGEDEQLCRILWCFRRLPPDEHISTIEALEEALEIAERLGSEKLVARAEVTLGSALAQGADPARAEEHLERALELYDDLDDRLYAGHSHNALAVVHCATGEYEKAREQFSAAKEAFEDVGDPVESAAVRNNLGVVLTRTGEWEEAEEILKESLELAERLDASVRLLGPCLNLARLYLAKGELETASGYWERLREVAEETGYWTDEVVALSGLGQVELRRGQLEKARDYLQRAQSAERRDEQWWEDRQELVWLQARLAAENGSWQDATEVAQDAQSALAEADRYLWATFRLFEGRVRNRLDGREALPAVEEALEVFRELGTAPKQREAKELLDEISEPSEGGTDSEQL